MPNQTTAPAIVQLKSGLEDIPNQKLTQWIPIVTLVKRQTVFKPHAKSDVMSYKSLQLESEDKSEVDIQEIIYRIESAAQNIGPTFKNLIFTKPEKVREV